MQVLIKLQAKVTDTLVQIITGEVNQQVNDLQTYIEAYQSNSAQLLITQKGRVLQIPKSSVLAAEIMGRQLTLYTNEQNYQTTLPLHQLIDLINSPRFIAVSKHSAVNVDAIRELSIAYSGSLTASLASGEQVQVARRYVRQVRDLIQEGK